MYTMEYYSAIRNNKYPPFASTWIELDGIMLSDISQSEKDKHYMVSFIWESKRIESKIIESNRIETNRIENNRIETNRNESNQK